MAKLPFDVSGGRNFLRETLFYKEKNFRLFQTLSQARSINCIICDQRSFFGKFSWGSSSYFIHFGLLAKTTQSVCQNCFLWALRIVLKEKGFFSKTFFPCFSDLYQTFLGLLAKIFGRVAKVPLEEPGGTFWEQCFYWKKILLFQNLRQRRSEKGKIFRLRSLNCIIRDQKNILRKCFRRFDDLFCQFRTFSKKNSERLSKLLSMSPEDSFENFFSKYVFSPIILDLEPLVLKLLVEKTRVMCQNYILRVQRIVVLKKSNFWKNR